MNRIPNTSTLRASQRATCRWGRLAYRAALVVTLVLGVVGPVMAQGPPAPRAECGQVTNAAGEPETSIQGCMNELLGEQLKMIDGIEQMGVEMRAITASLVAAGGTSQVQTAVLLNLMQDDNVNIQLMRDQHQRAMEENHAVEDTDYDDAFAKADQQKGKNCKFSDIAFVESLEGDFPPGLKPFSGDTFDGKFGDGKCNVFKARIDNPGEPNDDEVVHVNERSENMCERVCKDRTSDSSAAGLSGPQRNRKDERKDRTVFALTDNIAAARRANDDLVTANARMSALRIQLSNDAFRLSGNESDSCEPLDVARGLEEAAEVAGLIKNGVAIVTASLELAKACVRPPAGQDVAGFNAAAAEAPFAIGAGISKIIEQSFGFIESALKVAARVAARIQDFAQAQCLQKLQTTVEGTAEEIAELQAKVDALNARFDEVIELLNTPPGRRPDFPKKP